ncbi:MAG: DMT family transporter [Chloroherpetonaceae bacterium]|nr:DMT family transporter [Chloroherpetonaceae bacterium]
MTERERKWAIAAMLGQTLLAGSGFTFAHNASKEIPPVIFTFLRMFGASLIFVCYLFFSGSIQKIFLPFKDYFKLSVLALFGVTINQFLFLAGMKYALPANSALLYAMTPLFVMIISIVFLKSEGFSFQKGLGIAMAFTGALIVLFSRGLDFGFGEELWFGNLMILGAVISWAIYISLGKKIMNTLSQPIDSIASTALFMMIGFVQFLPIAIGYFTLNDFITSLQFISPTAWIGFAYVTVLGAAVAYLLLTYAISRLEASKVSIFMNAQPIVAATVSYLTIGERLSALFLIGGSIAIIGIFLTQQKDFFFVKKEIEIDLDRNSRS